MGKEMPESRKQYLKEYKKNNLKRIPLEVDYDFYIRLQQTAALMGKSVNGFIKEAILAKIGEYENGSSLSAADEKTRKVKEMIMAIGGGNG